VSLLHQNETLTFQIFDFHFLLDGERVFWRDRQQQFFLKENLPRERLLGNWKADNGKIEVAAFDQFKKVSGFVFDSRNSQRRKILSELG
jgi:hypothetical protein